MTDSNRKIIAIITRPYEDALRLKGKLVECNIDCIIESMLIIEPYNFAPLEINKNDIIIATSHNILTNLQLKTIDKDIRIITVGEQSTEKMLEYGFKNVKCGGHNVNELENYIKTNYAGSNQKFLYLSGNNITNHIDKNLSSEGFRVSRHVVYTATVAQKFSDNFINKIKTKTPKIIVFYSSRTADNFLYLAQKTEIMRHLHDIDAFCLSKNIADIYGMSTFKNTFIAANPCSKSLVELIYKKKTSA